MTESTQLQTAENNNAGVVKMEPLPPATTATTANTNLATSPAPSSVMEQQIQQQQTASIISATLQQQQQILHQQQQQQYALKWNDYQTSMLSSFRHLRDEEDFVDVTLACDERSFTAHKVVLSACSPYFRKLLKANPCEHPIVILRDVPADDVENLLSFMYNGEVNVGHEHLPEFLKTAHLLQIRGLADVNNGSSASFTSTLASSTPSNKHNSSMNSQLSGSTNKLNFLTAATQALSNSSNSPFTTPSLSSTTPLNNLLNNSSNNNNNSNNSNNNSNNNNNNSTSNNNNSNNNNNNSNSGKTPAIQELKASSASPANHWDLSDSDSNRNNHLTPPPQKRIKSADLFRAQHGISPERLLIDREFPVAGQHALTRNRDRSRETSHDRDREMRESLLGQALENTNGLQKPHPDMASLHAQSAGEDSNSSDTEPSDRGDAQNDATMDSIDNQRSHSFPNAFLGLQGIPGLLPGPSGMAANDFAADVQQNLGKFLTATQIKEELKEDEDIKEVENSANKDLSRDQLAMVDTGEVRTDNSPNPPRSTTDNLSPERNHLMVSHLNNNVVKYRSANSSPARSIRSWHDSDDENFVDDDGASSISSAISLTMKTSRHNSESALYQALLKKQQQQQQQQQQQHMITDTKQQLPAHQRHRADHNQQHQHSHQQHEHQQHKHQQHQQQQQQQQQYLDEYQQTAVTHQQQLTANLLMARTIAFSRSRDFPELFQNPAAVAAAAAAAATASAASANAAAAAASSSNYMLPCPLCETPLEQRVFRQHLDRHYPRDSPVCPVIECGRRFAHPNSVRNHMRIKHTLQWAKMKAMRSSGGPFAGGPDFK